MKKLLSVIPSIFSRHKSPPTKAVVLIHGLWMNHWVMHYIGRQFRLSGYAVYYFDYPSVKQDIQANVLRLDQFIQQIQLNSVFLVGHSLGGLICLEYLQKYKPVRVKRCVLLGAPLNGSQVAHNLCQKSWGRFVMGQSVPALTKSYQIESTANIGTVIGTGGKGLGRLFSPLHSPHDGAVALKEARVDVIEHQLILPVSHSTMLFSQAVANAAVRFCSRGAFSED